MRAVVVSEGWRATIERVFVEQFDDIVILVGGVKTAPMRKQ